MAIGIAEIVLKTRPAQRQAGSLHDLQCHFDCRDTFEDDLSVAARLTKGVERIADVLLRCRPQQWQTFTRAFRQRRAVSGNCRLEIIPTLGRQRIAQIIHHGRPLQGLLAAGCFSKCGPIGFDRAVQ